MNGHRKRWFLVVVLALGFGLAADSDTATAQESPHPLVAEAESLVVDFERIRSTFRELGRQLPELSGEDSLIISRERVVLFLDAFDKVHDLMGVLARQEKEGLNAIEFRVYVVGIIDIAPEALEAANERFTGELKAARSRLNGASPGDLTLIESEIGSRESRLDDIQDLAWRHIQDLELIGLDASPMREDLVKSLERRSRLTAGRLRLAGDERGKFEAQANQYPGETAFRQRADAAQMSVDGDVKSLERTIGVMDALGLDVTEYRTLIVESTGELARGLSDAKVAVSLVQDWVQRARDWFTDSGPGVAIKILVFLAIMLAFRVLARIVRKGVTRSMNASKFQPSQLMGNMITNMVGNLVMALGLLIALSQMGVSLGPLLAGLGVAGFILGFALQETLANFAAGIMILFYRPFDVGDMIEAAAVKGKVNDMSLVSTTILTIDNQTLIVPNGKIWGDVIRNVTAQTTRRVDMVFGIAYSDDIPHAEKVLRSILEEHDKVLKDPEPVVKLHELGDSSVNFVVRPWVDTSDYWEVYWDVTREVKMRFDREGINIPFPQRDVHLYEENPASTGDEAKSPQV